MIKGIEINVYNHNGQNNIKSVTSIFSEVKVTEFYYLKNVFSKEFSKHQKIV